MRWERKHLFSGGAFDLNQTLMSEPEVTVLWIHLLEHLFTLYVHPSEQWSWMKKECTRVQLEDHWVLHAKHHSSHLHIIMIIATEKRGQGNCRHHHHGRYHLDHLLDNHDDHDQPMVNQCLSWWSLWQRKESGCCAVVISTGCSDCNGISIVIIVIISSKSSSSPS